MEEGTRFGRYLLLECLSADSVSETFLAQREDEPGSAVRQVALKRMKPEASGMPGWMRAFLHEARIASHLRHPALPAMADFGESDGRFFLATDYEPGVTLETVLERRRGRGDGPLPWSVAVHVGISLCEGLLHVSRLRDREGAPLAVVHRDISPAAILLKANGGVRLLDHGVGSTTVRWNEMREGTLRTRLEYAAPELLRQEIPDERTDSYGIGMTLVEAIGGVPPFRRPTPKETTLAVMREKAKVAELVPETVPSGLVRLVQATLEKSGARRPSIAELREGLAGCLVKGKGFAGGTEIAALVAAEVPEGCRVAISAAVEEEPAAPAEELGQVQAVGQEPAVEPGAAPAPVPPAEAPEAGALPSATGEDGGVA